ncbi:TetR/AcrR family transcriptional regulator [Nonomuraea longispora]|uniref:TetR/AcrR family transcriptional regulator n=1 Tax=Nonomuraea longispora TaxID=1848320 RepID=A0A4R4NB55_9ACTN|nr:TetR family transcriptional regulator [Nonomuraea longispora]TDC06099.1 TetR/AcrR family transcriptional regulator [Nonomuraea longispora]
MRANESSGTRGRTFTESARRAQIVAATIETIAELGYARASFAQIAKRAGLSSTGLISYHFASKNELVKQAVIQIYGEITAFMTERLADQPTATEALRAYIEGNVEFSGAHRVEMKALLDIFINGGIDYGEPKERAALSPVEQILHWGQQTGEFREFDVQVMATSLQRSVEGPNFLLAGDTALDLRAYARELVSLFERATRADT